MRMLVALTCLTVGLLSGCGSPSASGTADGTTRSDILEFSGTTTSGEEFDGTTLAGRPAVLWFWAPWCPTCKRQVRGVTSLAGEYGDRVGFVGVGSLDDESAIDEFAATAPGLTHLTDPDGAVWRHFEITEQSVYVVLDEDGGIVADGYLDDADLADVVAELAG